MLSEVLSFLFAVYVIGIPVFGMFTIWTMSENMQSLKDISTKHGVNFFLTLSLAVMTMAILWPVFVIKAGLTKSDEDNRV